MALPLEVLLAAYDCTEEALFEALADESGQLPALAAPASGIDGLAALPLAVGSSAAAAALPSLAAVGLQLRVVCRILWAALLRWGRSLQGYPHAPYHPADLDTLQPWIADAETSQPTWTWLYLYGRALADRWLAEHPTGKVHAAIPCLDWLGAQPALCCGGPVLTDERRHPAANLPRFALTSRRHPEAALWRWQQAVRTARRQGTPETTILGVASGRISGRLAHHLHAAASEALAAGWEPDELTLAAAGRRTRPARAA